MENNIFIEPTNYYINNHIFDFDFSKKSDLIVLGTIKGEIHLVEYNQDETKKKISTVAHENSTRSVKFTLSGDSNLKRNNIRRIRCLSKTFRHKPARNNKNKNIRIVKIKRNPIYTVENITENIITTGDDEGQIKIFDTRTNKNLFTLHEQKSGSITDIKIDDQKQYLFATSTEGTLGVYDLRKADNSQNKLYALSDNMEADLNCIAFTKNQNFILIGDSDKVLQIYKKDDYGDHCDRIIGFNSGIESVCNISDGVLAVGCEDGWVRVCKVFPHVVRTFERHADDVEEDMPVMGLKVSRCGRFLGSVSCDFCLRFYDLQELEAVWGKEDLVGEVLGNGGEKGKQKAKNVQFFNDL